MRKESTDRIQLLQGVLDMSIQRTWLYGRAHGRQIAKHFCHSLAATGKKQLVAEESQWKKPVSRAARIMWPAEERR